MEYTKELLEQVVKEEEELVFTTFSNTDAKELGEMLYEESKKYERSVAVEIRKNGNGIYRFIPDGANRENSLWLKGKSNTVDQMERSSLRVVIELSLAGECPEDKKMNQLEYGLLGGGFPLAVKNTGIIGSICVSGLYHIEDHRLIVNTIRKYMLIHKSKEIG